MQGPVALYAGWEELNEAIQTLLAGIKTVAMEYSPNAEIPYISRVDAGTLEWIRSFGIEVRTSAELAQRVEARLSDAQAAGHQNSARLVLQAKDYAFAWIGAQLRDGKSITEYDVQQEILGAI